jgi:predicted RNA-binding protein with PUA domain
MVQALADTFNSLRLLSDSVMLLNHVPGLDFVADRLVDI